MDWRRGFLCFLLTAALASAAAAEERPEREFQECAGCPQMVGIPAGKFVMGSLADEPGRFQNEGPQHVVSIKAFALGKYDVTSEEFLAFLKQTGYQPAPCNALLNMRWRSLGNGFAYPPYDEEPRRWPASCLDTKDALAYIAWLNKKVRLERPGLAKGSGPYRLPSEAEWEYAARAGTATARWWGKDIGAGHANCNGCGSAWDNRELADVDSFAPNPFGLYGMLGNVWQWTADCWHRSYVGAPADGRAWTEPGCRKHVLRGGSWDNVAIFIRSATRSEGGADGGEYDYSSLAGFRVARDLP
ncbi:MAG: formylglycine-generating enzyme family protein [Alphaproteobacteria bacterium]|nr:formylglycine-generating enzyme family protein [Alphaproteobacteria bacterium]MDE2630624.1 formylglycine-generating enzyme family protein [Alphaproteobacteria bacterium]